MLAISQGCRGHYVFELYALNAMLESALTTARMQQSRVVVK